MYEKATPIYKTRNTPQYVIIGGIDRRASTLLLHDRFSGVLILPDR